MPPRVSTNSLLLATDRGMAAAAEVHMHACKTIHTTALHMHACLVRDMLNCPCLCDLCLGMPSYRCLWLGVRMCLCPELRDSFAQFHCLGSVTSSARMFLGMLITAHTGFTCRYDSCPYVFVYSKEKKKKARKKNVRRVDHLIFHHTTFIYVSLLSSFRFIVS